MELILNDINHSCICGSTTLKEAIQKFKERCEKQVPRVFTESVDYICTKDAEMGGMCFCMAFKFAESIFNKVILANSDSGAVLIHTMFTGWRTINYVMGKGLPFPIYRPSSKDLNSTNWLANV